MADKLTIFARSLLESANNLEKLEDDREASGDEPSELNRMMIAQMRRLGRMTATERDESLRGKGIDMIELARAIKSMENTDGENCETSP